MMLGLIAECSSASFRISVQLRRNHSGPSATADVTNNRVDMTRPLCPYPQVAVYEGSGSTKDAGNFACKTP
jgi:hypothetical protein